MSKRFYWLKFPADFFDSMRIKYLEKMSDSYVVIYLKMQTRSVATEGHIYYKGVLPSIDDEIALDVGRPTEEVKECITQLKRLGLVLEETEGYCLPYVVDAIGSESASASRMRKHRMSQSDTDVTQERNKVTIYREEKKREEETRKRDELPSYDSSLNPSVDISRVNEIRRDI